MLTNSVTEFHYAIACLASLFSFRGKSSEHSTQRGDAYERWSRILNYFYHSTLKQTCCLLRRVKYCVSESEFHLYVPETDAVIPAFY